MVIDKPLARFLNIALNAFMTLKWDARQRSKLDASSGVKADGPVLSFSPIRLRLPFVPQGNSPCRTASITRPPLSAHSQLEQARMPKANSGSPLEAVIEARHHLHSRSQE